MGMTPLVRLVMAVLLAGSGFTAWSAAHAQQQIGTVMELNGIRLAVSKEEMAALSDLGQLARRGESVQQNRALEEARRVVNSRDAQYVLALFELEIGGRRNDDTMRARALDILIDNQSATKDQLASYLAARGQIAFKGGNFNSAEKHWSRLTELKPSDPSVFANLAQVELRQNDGPAAMNLITRAISASEASGQTARQEWYVQRLSIAQQGNLKVPGIDAAHALVSAYPSAENWRAALFVYRRLVEPEGEFEIDFWRLARQTGALSRADEYQRIAQLLIRSGEPVEAKQVLDEGVGRGLLDLRTSPTREIKQEIDRTLADRSSETDATPVPVSEAQKQVRLGVSELLAGRQSKAEMAFQTAETAAPPSGYSDLATFWLTWLSQKGEPY